MQLVSALVPMPHVLAATMDLVGVRVVEVEQHVIQEQMEYVGDCACDGLEIGTMDESRKWHSIELHTLDVGAMAGKYLFLLWVEGERVQSFVVETHIPLGKKA